MRLSALCFILLTTRLALAATDAEELLEKVDAKLTKSNNQYLVWEMTTYEPGKSDRTLAYQATVKGRHYRRVDFLAPANIKGMKLLVRSPTQMYIYLPAFRKVRRVASHVQEQGFMGSAFDHAEVALSTYRDLFSAVSMNKGEETLTLVLERKSEHFPHARIELDIDPETLQMVEGRYFNAKGTHVKTEIRKDFACQAEFCTPHWVEMVDHTRNNLRSVMRLKKFKTNVDVPDSFFTVRALQRGN